MSYLINIYAQHIFSCIKEAKNYKFWQTKVCKIYLSYLNIKTCEGRIELLSTYIIQDSIKQKTIYMRFNILIPITIFLFIGSACVSSKKFKGLNANYEALQAESSKCKSDNSALAADKKSLEGQNEALNKKITDLNDQVAFLKENNTQALNQLENLSVVSSQQAESIRKSLENIGAKDAYIQSLQVQMAKKDSLNMALMMNLKGAIGDLSDKDINIKVDKGVVIIDISDKLLFKSGKYEVTDQAKVVLEKVAKVLKNQPDLEFMVEGHTDNVPYKGHGVLVDNWDLSVKRATTIVRLLQTQYGMDPKKMLAAGRSEYNPVSDNNTAEGKALNRRTRIVVLPELDQFFKLLEPQQQKSATSMLSYHGREAAGVVRR